VRELISYWPSAISYQLNLGKSQVVPRVKNVIYLENAERVLVVTVYRVGEYD